MRRHVDDGVAVTSTRRVQRGQSLTEFALVLPLVVLMAFGIFDLGRGVYAYNTVANAARTGARIAAVNQIADSSDCVNNRPVIDVADAHWSIRRCTSDAAVALGVAPGDVSVSYFAPPGSGISCASPRLGCIARVTVHYAYAPMTPLISGLVGTVTMDQVSEMPIERVFP
jgi:Flp pilus assembly protein TadG